MIIRIVEGTQGIQGTVSGTDQTVAALTNADDHTAPNVLRVWVENQSSEEYVKKSGDTMTGGLTVEATVSGIDFYTAEITASGTVSGTSGIFADDLSVAGPPEFTAYAADSTLPCNLYVESDGDFNSAFVQYSYSTLTNIMASARGTKEAPVVLGSQGTIGNWSFFGYDGAHMMQSAFFQVKNDDTISEYDVPSKFEFRVHPKGVYTGAPTNPTFRTVLELFSDGTVATRQRRSYGSTLTLNAFTINANEDDYGPDAGHLKGLWRLTPIGSHRIVTGLAKPVALVGSASSAQELTIINTSDTLNVTFNDQDTDSAEANRIITGTGADYAVGPSETIHLIYDTTSDRWRIISHHP